MLNDFIVLDMIRATNTNPLQDTVPHIEYAPIPIDTV